MLLCPLAQSITAKRKRIFSQWEMICLDDVGVDARRVDQRDVAIRVELERCEALRRPVGLSTAGRHSRRRPALWVIVAALGQRIGAVRGPRIAGRADVAHEDAKGRTVRALIGLALFQVDEREPLAVEVGGALVDDEIVEVFAKRGARQLCARPSDGERVERRGAALDQ